MSALLLILILLGIPALLILGFASGAFPMLWWVQDLFDFFTSDRHSRITLMVGAVVVLFALVFVIAVAVLAR